MSEQKKQVKCGGCGQLGHNKRTCPSGKEVKPETKPEIKLEPQIIYALEYADDNGDEVHRSTTLYASLDGLLNGIEKLIRNVQTDLCTDEDELSDTEDDDPPYYKDKLFYYTHHESMKEVPIPTREYVESVLSKKGYDSMDGMIIKVGSTLGGAACFGCEISVRRKTLNP
jgi:hypothetical protein